MPTFDWITYLTLARTLAEEAEESCKRSAISRAYYAAYNCALAYCNTHNIQITKNRGLHEDLWDAFDRQNSMILTTVQTKGDRLRVRRNRVDYDDEVSGLSSLVEHSLNDSHDILRSLGFNSPPP